MRFRALRAAIPRGPLLMSCKSDRWRPTTLPGPPPLRAVLSSRCRWTSQEYLLFACPADLRLRAFLTASSSPGDSLVRECCAVSLMPTRKQPTGTTVIRKFERRPLEFVSFLWIHDRVRAE